MKLVQHRSEASVACLNDWADVSSEDMADERGPRSRQNNADKSSEAHDPRPPLQPRELLVTGRKAQSCPPHHEEANREPRSHMVGYDHPCDGNKREREQLPLLRLRYVNCDQQQIDDRD